MEMIVPIHPKDISRYKSIVDETLQKLNNTYTKRYGIICRIIGKAEIINIHMRINSPYIDVYVKFNADVMTPKQGDEVRAVVISRLHTGYKLYAIKDGIIRDRFIMFVKTDRDLELNSELSVVIDHCIYKEKNYKCFVSIK